MNKLKIGIVCPYNMFTFAGGVQEIVKLQAAGLTKKGHQVRVITPRPYKYDGPIPVNVILLGTSAKISTPQQTMVDVSLKVGSEEITAMLEREKFDVLYFHEPLVPLLSRQILNNADCPTIATFHAALPDTRAGRSIASSISPYIKSITSKINVLTAVSPVAMSYIENYVQKPVDIIPNAIDVSWFSASPKSSDLGDLSRYFADKTIKTLLYIGRLEKRKGVDYLLEAFAKYNNKNPNTQLIVAGSGSSEYSLKNSVELLGVEDSVHFVGYVSDDQKRALLHNSDLYVSPARLGESFGIVLLEAMAAGIPMIAGNNPGYQSVMKGMGSLSVVDPRDITAFVERIDVFINGEHLRQMMIDWGKREVVKYNADRIMDLYEKALQKAASMRV